MEDLVFYAYVIAWGGSLFATLFYWDELAQWLGWALIIVLGTFTPSLNDFFREE